MATKLFASLRPTGKGVTENIIANAVIAGLAMTGSGFLAWFSEPRTNLGFVIMFLVALTVLSLAWLAFAFGYRKLNPVPATKSTGGEADAILPVRQRAQEEPPFLVRLAGGWDFVRVDQEVEGGGYEVVKIELVNARPVHVAGIEVFISGESHHLNTRRSAHKKIPKTYLTSRRNVDYLNSGGREEYVLLSREIHDRQDGGIRTFWGDYRFTADEKRLDHEAEGSAVHLVEITVTSPTTTLFSSRLMVVVTDDHEQIVPIDAKAKGWITISN
jgi:hypothetical protein